MPRLKQSQSNEDRFERLDIAFHERLRRGYLEIAKSNPQRCTVIDASQAVEVVAEKIATVLPA